jgi:hypothetical protein
MNHKEQLRLVVEQTQKILKEKLLDYPEPISYSEEEAEKRAKDCWVHIALIEAFYVLRQLHAENLEARRDHIHDVSIYDTYRFNQNPKEFPETMFPQKGE